jgi:hypothetical protein
VCCFGARGSPIFSFVEEKKTVKEVIDHGTGDDAMKILGRPQEVPHILFRPMWIRKPIILSKGLWLGLL